MSIDDIIVSAKIGLKNTKYPVKTLGIFYTELFGGDKNIYKTIAGLTKKYSPEIIFNAIIDLYDAKLTNNKIYPIKYYCEVRFDQKKLADQEIEINIDLDDYIKQIQVGAN